MPTGSPHDRFPRVISLCTLALVPTLLAAPPQYDHVVIVIEENHSFQDIIGNPNTPYMNWLAQNGALLTDMYGMVHPSQPNYLHFFSGDDQSVTTNDPVASPLSTPNLAASLIAAGRSFVSYCEDLPEAGSTIAVSGAYYRKHNPIVNWQSDPPGTNQVPSGLNRPFTDFPTDFGTLPTVSIVVPNQLHDMHDGTPAQADAWLVANIAPYAQWCETHNSLLIVTWDEDSFASANQIPTIIYGPGVRTGTFDTRWTLHNLLRTIQDMHGASPSGAAAFVEPISVFDANPSLATTCFQQGLSGYAGTQDTWIEQASPAAAHGTEIQLTADGSPLTQSLIRFDSIFGSLLGQVPPNAIITSAKLSLYTGATATDASVNAMSLYRLTTPFTSDSTWQSLVSGISVGSETLPTPDFTFKPRNNSLWVVFDATASLRAWNSGQSNLGWAIIPTGTDGWRPASSENPSQSLRPLLSVSYYVPTACDSIDFNNDSSLFDPIDIDAFLSVYGEGPCVPEEATCNDIDFNNDGSLFDPCDIDSFLLVFSEGPCTLCGV